MLLQLIGLKCSTFFYHRTKNVDKDAEIVQKIAEIYHGNHGNYDYRRIMLVLQRMAQYFHATHPNEKRM